MICILSLLIVLVHAAVGQDTTGAGTLQGFLTGTASAANAQVCLSNGRCERTDAEGRFRFPNLRPGAYQLTAAGLSVAVEVRAGLSSEVEISLAQLATRRDKVEVTASVLLAPEEIKTSAHLVGAEVLRTSAAALKDVSRHLQTLPGVVFGGNDFRNDIVVRGGSPLENLYIIDNIEIPNINHFANFASAGGPVGQFNSELLSDLTFLTGGYPAAYNNRLSSVVQITQREGKREHLAGQATLGFGGAGAIGEGPLGKKGSWIASARRSFLDVVTDDIGFGGVPIYTNFQGKAVYDLNASNRLWLSSIGGRDSIIIRPQADKEDQEADPYNVDSRGWRNAAGVNWQHLFAARGVGLLGFTHSRGSVDSQVSDLRLDNSVVSRQQSSEDEISTKYDVTLNVPVLERLQAGASARWYLLHYRTAAPFGQENAFSQRPGRVNPVNLREDFTTSQQSSYVQFTRTWFSRLSMTAGSRLDRYAYIRATRFSPRLGFTLRLTPRLSAHASAGSYAQQPFFVFLTADPVNRGLVPMRADHLVTGVTWTPAPSLRVTVEAYEKRYRDYPVALEYPQVTLASAGDAYGPNYYLIPLTSAGRGRTRGIEFLLKKKLTKRLYGQASFTSASSRHSALDGVSRPGGFDSRYLSNITGGYRLSGSWEVAARWVYFSGRPYTPFNSTLSVEQNRAVFDLQRVNAVRARPYQRLDLRIDHYANVWRGTLNSYFGLQNVFNRDNFYTEIWNFRSGRPKTLTQLGAFPIGGFEWRFR